MAGLRSKKFLELWPDMIIHYSDEYLDILRLAAITLLVPTDTSECERIFKLMNDIKTAMRNRFGSEKLNNLMVWHTMGRRVTFISLSLPLPDPSLTHCPPMMTW